MPYYQDNHIRIFNKDCRSMSELPDESVQCVVTSPPYWGLRKYSGEQELIWLPLDKGKDCEHKWGSELVSDTRRDDFKNWEHNAEAGISNIAPHVKVSQGNFCIICGAWKGSYGLEPTPEMYIEHTIEILREIRRVLRKDGVVFWNIGDSYATHASGGKGYAHNFRPPDVAEREGIDQPKPSAKSIGLKEKDLCLIPQRLMIAAQEDGWWVRSVIIWSKPNPMPESVKDRPTESHEYILMLTKSGTTQYWTHRDHEGTRTQPQPDYRWVKDGVEVAEMPEGWTLKNKMGWDRINLWKGHDYYWDADAVREEYSPTIRWGGDKYKGAVKKGTHGEDAGLDRERSCFPNTGRNLRSVWEFPTQPYPEAHFAVFPEKLPEICIKAATPEVGCCNKCGAPWERILDKKPSEFNIRVRDAKAGRASPEEGYKATQEEIDNYPSNHPDPGYRQTTGWQPTCKCNADKVPSIVLDPFLGAGTVAWVAKKLNRYAVGYEISEEYCQLAVDRCQQQVLLWTIKRSKSERAKIQQ